MSVPQLAKIWEYAGFQAISRGTVTPGNVPFIILFITDMKQSFFPQYADSYSEGVLEIEGERKHKTDRRMIEAESEGVQIHLFHRAKHHQPFIYEGRIFLVEWTLEAVKPSRFKFSTDPFLAKAVDTLKTEEEAHGPSAPEGDRTIYQRFTYERSRFNRAQCLRKNGTVCHVCGFDFNRFYGAELARSFIEVPCQASRRICRRGPGSFDRFCAAVLELSQHGSQNARTNPLLKKAAQFDRSSKSRSQHFGFNSTTFRLAKLIPQAHPTRKHSIYE